MRKITKLLIFRNKLKFKSELIFRTEWVLWDEIENKLLLPQVHNIRANRQKTVKVSWLFGVNDLIPILLIFIMILLRERKTYAVINHSKHVLSLNLNSNSSNK